MVMTITDILNRWNQVGVFSYLLPFLLIFALVFAILQKSGLFAKNEGTKDVPKHKHNSAIEVIIAAAIAMLSLQFDQVSIFFANIFPKFGIGLAVFLVFLIFLGFFFKPEEKSMKWIVWLVGIGVVLWVMIAPKDF